MLKDSINEFELAAVMDTYNRTFPQAIQSYAANDLPVITKYGLTLIPSGKIHNSKLDELHIIDAVSNSAPGDLAISTPKVVQYNYAKKQYIIDACLFRIKEEYGQDFEKVVKLMLDYN